MILKRRPVKLLEALLCLRRNMELFNGDCLELMKNIPDKSVDLVVTDPPYEFHSGGEGGAFGRDKRTYHRELYDSGNLDKGCPNEVLRELMRVMVKPNIYLWCNKNQLGQYIEFFEGRGCTTDLLTWHKTNPVPTCNNKYLSDTEYILYFRAGGVPMYGSYNTKKKYYITPTNKADKNKWGHPTMKPVDIIKNLVINSSKDGDTILDPFMGSGTTGVAVKELGGGRKFVGIEVNPEYYAIAQQRIEET